MNKLILVTIGAFLAMTVSGWSQGVQSMMKEKARGFRTNSVSRGMDTTGGGGRAAAAPRPVAVVPQAQPAPAPAKPKVEEEKPFELPQAQAVPAKKLLNSLERIKSTATPEQVQGLVNALMGAALTGQPSIVSITRLAGDLADAWPRQKLGEKDREQVAQYIVFLFNSSGVPESQTQRAVQKTEKLLQASGMPGDSAQSILADVRMIQKQIQK